RRLARTASGEDAGPVITAVFMMNGGLFADAHTHPWQTTPLLRTPLGRAGDAARTALGAGVRHDHAAGPPLLPRLPSHSGGAGRAPVGNHPPERSGVPAQRGRLRRRTPPPRAAVG